MPSGRNNMYNKSDDQFLAIKATIECSRQDYDDKIKKVTEDLTAIITSMMDQIKTLKYSQENKYQPKDQDTDTVAPNNKKAPPLNGGHFTKIGGM